MAQELPDKALNPLELAKIIQAQKLLREVHDSLSKDYDKVHISITTTYNTPAYKSQLVPHVSITMYEDLDGIVQRTSARNAENKIRAETGQDLLTTPAFFDKRAHKTLDAEIHE